LSLPHQSVGSRNSCNAAEYDKVASNVIELFKPQIVFPATFVVVAYAGLGAGFGSGFEEASFATAYSVLMMAAASWACFQVAKQRDAETGGQDGVRFFWRFVGFAFAFLALDEGLQIHENLDKLVHIILGLTETAWTDRIDDFLILGYGLAGVAFLIRYRSEILRVPNARWYLGLAFGLTLVSVTFDVLSNRNEYLDWLNLHGQAREDVDFFADLMEEGGKLFAVSALLIGFASAFNPTVKRS
jgi:hypothetical protein